jgi:MFS family permease
MRFLKSFDTYRGLPKAVYVIFVAQIINRFGDFVRPFLTLFLTSQFHYSIAYTGTIVMLSTLVTIPGSFIGGKAADHWGRKQTYMIAQFMAGLALFVCTFVYRQPVMIWLILASSFFSGAVRPIIGAMLADVLSPEDRQRGFSLSYLGINIGVALGPIVAGFLFNHLLFMVFLGDAVTSFIAVALVGMQVAESLPDKTDSAFVSEAEQHAEGSAVSILIKRPLLLLFLIFNVFFSASYVQTGFSLPLMMDALYGASGAPIFGTLMSLNAVTVILLTISVTRFSQRFKPITNIAISGLTYMIGFGMIGWIKHIPFFWLSTVIWTLGEIISAVNFGVYITNHTPQNFRARFNAITNLSFSIGAILGTAVIGRYIDSMDIYSVWWLVGAFAAIGTVGMFGIGYLEKRQRAQ